MDKVYTHDEAMMIVEVFEDLLSKHGIKLPSPEDDDRDPDNDAALYGSTYDNTLTLVEYRLIDMLNRHKPDSTVVTWEFSGTV